MDQYQMGGNIREKKDIGCASGYSVPLTGAIMVKSKPKTQDIPPEPSRRKWEARCGRRT